MAIHLRCACLLPLMLAACGIDIHDHPSAPLPVAASADQVHRTIDQLPTSQVAWELSLDVACVRRVRKEAKK